MSQHHQSDQQGFTLVETLVVIIMISVLASISIPGWLAFTNRQRVKVTREQVVDVLRRAQSEAIRTRSDRFVFVTPTTAGVSSITETIFEETVVNADRVTLGSNVASVPFDHQGAIDVSSLPDDGLETTALAILTVTSNDTNDMVYCAKVQTILGAIVTDEEFVSSDTNCDL